MHASLCGGGYLLKALGSVASFLADRLFNLSNDNSLCPKIRVSRSKILYSYGCLALHWAHFRESFVDPHLR